MKKALVLFVVLSVFGAMAFANGASESVNLEGTVLSVSDSGNSNVTVQIKDESGQVYQFELTAAEFASLGVSEGSVIEVDGDMRDDGSSSIKIKGITSDGQTFSFEQENHDGEDEHDMSSDDGEDDHKDMEDDSHDSEDHEEEDD